MLTHTFIYTLSDPRTNQIRYVGKTNNPFERSKAHNNVARDKSTHKRNWVNSLKKHGLKPVFEIVDTVLIAEWKYWEKYWICQFKTWGFELVNYTEGGDGATFANSGSFKKGQVSWNLGKAKPKPVKPKLGHANASKLNWFRPMSSPWNSGITGYSLPTKGRKRSAEAVEKTASKVRGVLNKGSSKPIQQIDKRTNKLIHTFPSAAEAKRITGFHHIVTAAGGFRKTSGGYVWRYIV